MAGNALATCTDYHVFAGFLDGEGCIRVQDGVVVVEVTTCSLPSLQELREVFGGNLRRRKKRASHHRRQWTWSVRGAEACVALIVCEEFLREKRAQAAVALAYCKVCDSLEIGESGRRAAATILDKSLRYLKTMEHDDAPPS